MSKVKPASLHSESHVKAIRSDGNDDTGIDKTASEQNIHANALSDKDLDALIIAWSDEPCKDYGYNNKRANAMYGYREGYRAAEAKQSEQHRNRESYKQYLAMVWPDEAEQEKARWENIQKILKDPNRASGNTWDDAIAWLKQRLKKESL